MEENGTRSIEMRPFNKFHKRGITVELDEREFEFEDPFDEDFWVLVHGQYVNTLGHEFKPFHNDVYEAFQLVRIARLKEKLQVKQPESDPFVLILELCRNLLDSSRYGEFEDEVNDLLGYYLYWDKVECDAKDEESVYAELIDVGQDESKTVAHLLLSARLPSVLTLALDLHPHLRLVSSRGTKPQMLEDIANESGGITQELYEVMDKTKDHTPRKNAGPYRGVLSITKRVDPILKKRLEEEKRREEEREKARREQMEKDLPPGLVWDLGHQCAARGSESRMETVQSRYMLPQRVYSTSQTVFMLFAKQSQRKFAHRLCSKLEIASQGSLKVADAESWMRSRTEKTLLSAITECNTLVVLLSEALEALVVDKKVTEDSLLPKKATDENLADILKSSDNSGQKVIALKEAVDGNTADSKVSFLRDNHTLVSLESSTSALNGKALHGLGMRLYGLLTTDTD